MKAKRAQHPKRQACPKFCSRWTRIRLERLTNSKLKTFSLNLFFHVDWIAFSLQVSTISHLEKSTKRSRRSLALNSTTSCLLSRKNLVVCSRCITRRLWCVKFARSSVCSSNSMRPENFFFVTKLSQLWPVLMNQFRLKLRLQLRIKRKRWPKFQPWRKLRSLLTINIYHSSPRISISFSRMSSRSSTSTLM